MPEQPTPPEKAAPTARPVSLPPCEVFRVGDHQTSSGDRLSFSAADLDATVAAYNAAAAPSPVVVGHPRADAPAYGWIKSFKRVGDKLIAETEHVDAAFAALVKEKKFRKVSMAFFRPDDASNPAPGVWYPRHLGFLGAAAPAVIGLKPVNFSDGDGYVEFDAALYPIASFLRRLREWLIEKFDQDTADRVIPDWQIEDVKRMAEEPDEDASDPTPAFSAQPPGGPAATPKENETMSEQDKQELERLRAENAQLKATELAHAAAAKAQATAASRAEFTALADSLIKDGRMLPVDKDAVVAFAASLPDELAVEFTAADGTTNTTPSRQWFKGFLSRLPKQITFGAAADAPAAAAAVEFSAPAGSQVDQAQLAVHHKANAYMAAHPGTDYETAINAVGGV